MMNNDDIYSADIYAKISKETKRLFEATKDEIGFDTNEAVEMALRSWATGWEKEKDLEHEDKWTIRRISLDIALKSHLKKIADSINVFKILSKETTKEGLLSKITLVNEALEGLCNNVEEFNKDVHINVENVDNLKMLAFYPSDTAFFTEVVQPFLSDNHPQTLEFLALITLYYSKVVLTLLYDGFFDELLKVKEEEDEESVGMIVDKNFVERHSTNLFLNLFDFMVEVANIHPNKHHEDYEPEIFTGYVDENLEWHEEEYFISPSKYEEFLNNTMKVYGLTDNDKSHFAKRMDEIGRFFKYYTSIQFITEFQPMYLRVAKTYLLWHFCELR